MTLKEFIPGETKVTSRRKLDEWHNSMWSGSEWKITGRTYNAARTNYLAWKIVLSIDYSDLWDDETGEEIPLSEYIENAIDSYLDILYSSGPAEFIDACNETIHRYNSRRGIPA